MSNEYDGAKVRLGLLNLPHAVFDETEDGNVASLVMSKVVQLIYDLDRDALSQRESESLDKLFNMSQSEDDNESVPTQTINEDIAQ